MCLERKTWEMILECTLLSQHCKCVKKDGLLQTSRVQRSAEPGRLLESSAICFLRC